MKANVWVAFWQFAETLVRAVVGLLLGFVGLVVALNGFYQLANINASFFGGTAVVFVVSLAVGGLLLWFAGKLLNSLVRRGRSA